MWTRRMHISSKACVTVCIAPRITTTSKPTAARCCLRCRPYAEVFARLTVLGPEHRIHTDMEEPIMRSTTGEHSSRSTHLVNTLALLRVIPTGAALGAEIQGIDFSAPVTEEVREALRKAWADHLVLLFRGQSITDHQLIDAAGIFGPPHDAASRKYHLDVGKKIDNRYMISEHPSVSIISNLDPNGKPVQDNGGLGSYEVVWHTDNSYVAV